MFGHTRGSRTQGLSDDIFFSHYSLLKLFSVFEHFFVTEVLLWGKLLYIVTEMNHHRRPNFLSRFFFWRIKNKWKIDIINHQEHQEYSMTWKVSIMSHTLTFCSLPWFFLCSTSDTWLSLSHNHKVKVDHKLSLDKLVDFFFIFS